MVLPPKGGASFAFRQSNDLPAVCFVGRWNHIRTARIYITDALAQLTEIHLEGPVRQRLLTLAKRARPRFNFDL
jgi:hypothetical protein